MYTFIRILYINIKNITFFFTLEIMCYAITNICYLNVLILVTCFFFFFFIVVYKSFHNCTILIEHKFVNHFYLASINSKLIKTCQYCRRYILSVFFL